jgi:RNA polymerase sigma factor (sigma-70 family)
VSKRDSYELVDDLFRRESGRLIALLTSRAGPMRIDAVEDAVQDALVAAMRHWPLHGIPENPAAWLYSAARNALTDRLRRLKFETQRPDIDPPCESLQPGFPSEGQLNDELLRLIVYCCHPLLSQGAQVALTLRLACGLSVQEIAEGLLTTPESVAQRIVRAKRELRNRQVTFDLPTAAELVADRLPGILNVIYLLFDAGYLSAQHGEWIRPVLCADAVRIVRILAAHPATAQPETHALAALLHLSAARLPARVDAAGQPIPLAEQDRSKWDGELIAAGYRHLGKASRGDTLTRYHIEAAIAAVHARATCIEDTDWQEILAHYDDLCMLCPGPVSSLNRIIALRYAQGAQPALQALMTCEAAARLQDSLIYQATLAELHDALGEHARAAEAFTAAAGLAGNPTIAELLQKRARAARSRLADPGSLSD